MCKLIAATALALSLNSPAAASRMLNQEVEDAEAIPEIDGLALVANKQPKAIDAKPALWFVQDDDTTIFMFGTVHVLKPGLEWFDEDVKAAFDASDTLIMELPDGSDKDAQALFGKLAMDQDGKTLRSKLNEEELAVYEAAMTELGLPAATFDPFEPWAAAITMQVMAMTKAGYAPGSGAESVLTSAAKQAKKPIKGLETMEYQLGIFDGLPEEKQIEFLIEGARDLDASNKMIDDLVESWAAGDPEALGELMNAGFADPLIKEKLLTQRNANWARWINKRMAKPGTVFIAVGAGHLSGSTSVQHMMTAYGLKAAQISY